MLTIDALKSFGANADEGLTRCMNMEDFYLRLVKTAAEDTRLDELEAQINAGDLDAAFETAHALKGICANLSLDPLTAPVTEITELLRSRTETDYSPLLSEAKKQYAVLLDICSEN